MTIVAARPDLDTDQLLARLDRQLAGTTDARQIRAQTVAMLALTRSVTMEAIEAAFATHPRAARETVRATP